MTNDEIPNDEGNPKSECRIGGAPRPSLLTLRSLSWSFVLRHSFVIGYFVIRHLEPFASGATPWPLENALRQYRS